MEHLGERLLSKLQCPQNGKEPTLQFAVARAFCHAARFVTSVWTTMAGPPLGYSR